MKMKQDPGVIKAGNRIRREVANLNERKRMANINAALNVVRGLLPVANKERVSKAVILQEAAKYIIQLKKENSQMVKDNNILKQNLALVRQMQQNRSSDSSSVLEPPSPETFDVRSLSPVTSVVQSFPSPGNSDVQSFSSKGTSAAGSFSPQGTSAVQAFSPPETFAVEPNSMPGTPDVQSISSPGASNVKDKVSTSPSKKETVGEELNRIEKELVYIKKENIQLGHLHELERRRRVSLETLWQWKNNKTQQPSQDGNRSVHKVIDETPNCANSNSFYPKESINFLKDIFINRLTEDCND